MLVRKYDKEINPACIYITYEQAEQAFHKGEITEFRLNRFRERFDRKEKYYQERESKIERYASEYGFIDLKSHRKLMNSDNQSTDLVSEYLDVFLNEPKFETILSFSGTRLGLLVQELMEYDVDPKVILREVSFLQSILPHSYKSFYVYFQHFLEHFTQLATEEQKERIYLLKKIENGYDAEKPEVTQFIFLKEKDRVYDINRWGLTRNVSQLYYLNNVSNELLKIAVKGGNCFYENIFEDEDLERLNAPTYWFYREPNSHILNKLKGLSAARKSDQEQIISILEEYFESLKQKFEERLPKDPQVFLDVNQFVKLIKLQLKKCNTEKVEYWLNWYDYLIDIHMFNTAEAAYSRYVFELHLSWDEIAYVVPYGESKNIVRELGVSSAENWKKYTSSGQRPLVLPKDPEKYYRNRGWVSFDEWLGVEKQKSNVYRSFLEARNYTRSLGLKSEKEWRVYRASGKKPRDIPSSPDKVFAKTGWAGFPDWLGYVTKAKIRANSSFRSFEEAKAFVKDEKIRSISEWRTFIKLGKKPDDIPSNPEQFYEGKGWKGSRDFFGTGEPFEKKENVEFLPYSKARSFVHELKISSSRAWNQYCQSGSKPLNIPSSPEKVYKDLGWTGYEDWLGKEHKVEFLSFEESRKYMRTQSPVNEKEWKQFKRDGLRPAFIPGKPEKVYKGEGWKGYIDWLVG